MFIFSDTLTILPNQDNLKLFIKLLKIVLSCESFDPRLRAQVIKAYFLNAVTPDMFNGNVTELELADSKLNLLISDEDYFADRTIGENGDMQ